MMTSSPSACSPVTSLPIGTKIDIPHDESQLVPHTIRAQVKLEIIHDPAAVLFGQLGGERVKVLVGRGLEHDDVFLVVRDAVDDVGVFAARLELLVLFEAVGALFWVNLEFTEVMD